MSVDKNNHANGRFEDMTGWNMWEHGVQGSRLTVIKRVDNLITKSGHKQAQWLCKCNCGSNKTVIAITANLKNGNVRSCGCLATETSRKLLTGNSYGCKNKKRNDYDYSREYGVGYATNNGHEFYFDWEDFDLIRPYTWLMNKDGYIVANDYSSGKRKHIKMHRLIMDANPGSLIDHKKHERHDNRKEKLRHSDINTNHFNHEVYKNNTSGVTGVNWDADSGKWRARLWAYGKMYHLGRFDNFEDAVKARKEAEEKYFGEFSYDNSMKEDDNELQQSS